MPTRWQDRWEADEKTPILRGGHGVVRRVVARDDGRAGALKVLNDDAEERKERRFRLREEVNALRALTSGVPKLYDTNAAELDGAEQLFLVMEWIPGPTLGQRIGDASLSLDEALECTRALLETLQRMHALPLVHRDLKPDNIILRNGAADSPIIIDLGLAWGDNRADDEFETERGQEMGNRFLRLPEFAPGRAHRDPRSDVTLAAGLLLFMLTGRAPRLLRDEQGRAPHEALSGHIPKGVTADSRWTRLARVFSRAFQTEVAVRFQSVADFREALSNLTPSAPAGDALGPALERLRSTLESAKSKAQQKRLDRIAVLGAKFDAHLRGLLAPTGLSLPGRHGFTGQEVLVYMDGISLARPSGSIVCTLNHEIWITETELSATYGIEDLLQPIEYYRGSAVDIDALEEAMWANSNRLVAFAIDEFNKRVAR
jgi:serine/threonine protein kinase